MTMMQALQAPGRAADIPAEHDVYGWLAGDWTLDVLHYRTDVRDQALKGSAHFAWVLEGRAVQDVWILKAEGIPTMYGTTLRMWDPALQAWRVSWVNPASGARSNLIGRRLGGDLVQIGTHADGTPIRWRFTDITPTSFHWIGEALQPDGVIWRIEAEFLGRKET